jgi:hypothetical protein
MMQKNFKIAYVILAHQYPDLLSRLVERLSCPYADFFIHIDRSKDIKPFQASLSRIKIGVSSVTFIKRTRSPWGSIGLVKATLDAFIKILQSLTIYDYVIILSGQDYPLKSNNEILSFFKENYGKNYMSYFLCTDDICKEEWKLKIVTNRLGKYHINLFGKRYEYPSESNILLNFFFSTFLEKERRHPCYLKPYADSQWFCITIDAVKYILNFIEMHPDFLHYHRYTYIPDELFFQTILLNSEGSLRESIVNNNLKYIDWSKPDVFHPMIFSENHFTELMASKKLFARKFDPNICSNILDIIDCQIYKL